MNAMGSQFYRGLRGPAAPDMFASNVRHHGEGRSMVRKMIVGFVALGTATLAACGSARVVQRTQYGGVIALEGDRGKAMDGAHREMSAHCGSGNYQIVQEGEEPVGTVTEYGERTDHDRRGSSSHGVQETTTKTEWRIHYQCGGADDPGPGADY
jgi:hypothetical protein